MSRRLKLALLGCILGLALPGCGDADEPRPVAGERESATTVAPEPPKDPPEGRGIVTGNPDGTRTVRSSYGTTTVPAKPRRVVSVLGYVDFESMLALGVTPVGAGTQGGTVASGFAPHLEGRTAGIQPLGWADGAPVEAIAALRPDLIFAPDEESAKLVAAIAPTVPGGSANGGEWNDNLRYIAAVLGRSGDGERLLDEYEAEAKRLRARLQRVIAGQTVASPQVSFDRSQVYIDHKGSFSSTVLTEVGFTLAPVVTEATKIPIAMSFEQLPELKADLLFWQVRQRDEDGSRDAAGFQTVKDSPLWGRVPAVAGGRVFEVDNRPWYFPTLLAAHQILDDVEEALL